MWIVRKGYTLIGKNYIIEAGAEVPAPLLPIIRKERGWLIEEIKEVKVDAKETEEDCRGTDSSEEEGEKRKEEKIKSIAKDRMFKSKEAKTK